MFNKYSFRQKFIFVFCFPLIGLLFFGGSQVIEKARTARSMSNLVKQAALSAAASNLVHEMQKERGLSAGYVGSGGTKFAEKLQSQRQLTDARMVTLQNVLRDADLASDSPANLNFTSAIKQLSKLAEYRSATDNLKMATSTVIDYYTSTNARLLDGVNVLSANGSHARTVHLGITYTNFLQAKERAGIERAVGSGIFAADQVTPEAYARFVSKIAAQETFLRSFQAMASKEQVNMFEATVSGDAVREVERMREIIKANPTASGLGVDASHWFSSATDRINLMKEVENKLAGELVATAKTLGQRATSALVVSLVLAVGIIAASFILGIMVIRQVLVQVASLDKTMQKIVSESDLQLRVKSDSTDELGSMARCFNKLMDKFEDLVGHLADTSTQLAAASEQLSAVTEITNQNMNDHQSQTDSAVASMTQMTSTVRQVADNASHAAESTDKIAERGRSGRDVVQKAVSSIQTLASEVDEACTVIQRVDSESEKIGLVVNVIRDIADQTNLLALNAAIEAARAGEQGRGFAVVADEVRTLANRTQESTQEIESIIEGLQEGSTTAVNVMQRARSCAQDGVSQISDTGDALSNILTALESINATSSQIATASLEQNAAAEEISSNIVNINQAAIQTSESTNEIATASQNLSNLASQLQNRIADYKY